MKNIVASIKSFLQEEEGLTTVVNFANNMADVMQKIFA